MLGEKNWKKYVKERWMEEQLVDENGENLPNEIITPDDNGEATLSTVVQGSEFKLYDDVPEGVQVDITGNVMSVHVDIVEGKRPAKTFQVTEQKANPTTGELQISIPRTITTEEVLFDITGPKVVPGGLSPEGDLAENKTNFDLKMNFDENVVVGTGMIYIYGTYEGPDGNESGVRNYTFPASDLIIDGSTVFLPVEIDKFTYCYINMDEGVLLDTSGNAFAGMSDESWWFKTKDFATGIDDVEKADFKIYPTPFVDHINISNTQELGRVEIVNALGQMVDHIDSPQEYVSLSHLNLKAGIHFVRLFDRDGKLLKNEKMMKK